MLKLDFEIDLAKIGYIVQELWAILAVKKISSCFSL